MEVAIRSFLRDPVFGIPLLLFLLVLVAHAAVFLRSVANGDAVAPSIKVFSADLSIVLLAELLFILSKMFDLFVPAEGTKIAGIDVSPFYTTVGPLAAASAALALAVWLAKLKLTMILAAAAPPAAKP